jgi:hypothetical protein
MTTRAFHLGDVLSVTTERLISPRHMKGIYDILDYMTGDSLFTHQLRRAGDECKPALLAQHPQLANVKVPNNLGDSDDPKQEVATWLAEQVEQYGETLEVEPLAAEAHTVIDPLDELAMRLGGDRSRIIPVVVNSDGGSP